MRHVSCVADGLVKDQEILCYYSALSNMTVMRLQQECPDSSIHKHHAVILPHRTRAEQHDTAGISDFSHADHFRCAGEANPLIHMIILRGVLTVHFTGQSIYQE